MAQFLQIHAQMLRTHHLFIDPFAAGKLLEFCTVFPRGSLRYACKLFDQIPHPTPFAWNTLIRGFANSPSLPLFRRMLTSATRPNSYTYPFLLKACTRLSALAAGEQLHGLMLKFGADVNIFSVSGLIHMYCACGRIDLGRRAFEGMKDARMRPNWAAIASALSACSQLGALDRGRRVHAYIETNKMKVESIIGTTLIDMYAKCGCIERALGIFNELESKDVFSWTTIIGGLAVNGHGARALELFGRMEEDGVAPNEVTFVGVLCACSHGGWVELDRRYFDSMRAVYGLEPQIEHYGCVVDALGRAGLLDEAVSLVHAMPTKSNAVLWGTLLGACWIHGNAEIGEYVVKQLTELNPDDGGVYVLLSNIYAMGGRWSDAKKVRMLMKSKGLEKTPGCSSIEVRDIVHEFYVGDRSHPDTMEIYWKLDEIGSRLKITGYEPNTKPVMFDIEEEEKEDAFAHHSEKLAIAYGLVSTDEGAAIRVVENLRVCRDCHTVAKLVSKVYNREIILRDKNVFHYFRGGSCSCRDY